MTHPTSPRLVFPISRSRTPCGVEAFTRRLAEACQASGIEARAVALDETRALGHLMRAGDAIICNFPVVAWKRSVLAPARALAQAWMKGVQRVVVLHEWAGLDWKRRLVIAVYLRFANLILFSSPFVDGEFRASLTGRQMKSVPTGILPIPPNLRRSEPVAASALSRQMADWRAEGHFVLGYFGSIYPKKQTVELLDIAATLKARGLKPKFVCIGGFVRASDAIEAVFHDRVRALGLQDDVIVTGYVEAEAEAFGLFAEVDAFVYMFQEGLTSRRGSVLACLQSGRPVIVNAPIDGGEFDHHSAYRTLLAAGLVRLVATHGSVDDYADALIAARALPANPGTLDFDACWRDAAAALAASLGIETESNAPAPPRFNQVQGFSATSKAGGALAAASEAGRLG